MSEPPLVPLEDGLEAEDDEALVSAEELTSIADVVVKGTAQAVRHCAQDWARRCQQDPRAAIQDALGATLELAGLPEGMRSTGWESDPADFVSGLADWAQDHKGDCVYPLDPAEKQSKRAVSNFERFWGIGIGAQDPGALLESKLVGELEQWLVALPKAAVRSVRYASTVAALAVAEALGHHAQTAAQMEETLNKQLAANTRGGRRQQQLQRDLERATANAQEMYAARMQLLESTVPARSRDASETIRLHTLSHLERMMKQDPEMYLQNKWTARIFLMIHDPCAEVRLQVLKVIDSWYSNLTQRSEEEQEHLKKFAQKALSHLVERVGDVDPKIAVAALRCLRLPALAAHLEEEEFDTIVNLSPGSGKATVRAEAALFVNAHVFQEPGICPATGSDGDRKRAHSGGDARDGEGDEARGVARDEAIGLDVVKDLYSSETSLTMLVEYLENYNGDHLRFTDRVVAAFWGRAPALIHWGTMVNLCLLGEGHGAEGVEPVNPQQRLALLYVMEASLRRACEDLRGPEGKTFAHRRMERDRGSAVVALNDACGNIIPELSRLFDICRPEEQQTVLLSHVCKMLVEYAVENSQNQVLANAKDLCQALSKSIMSQPPLDTAKFCTDALLALARCLDEAKGVFLDLTKQIHSRVSELIEPEALAASSSSGDLSLVMTRFVVLTKRGIDMTFGGTDMLYRFVALCHDRAEWCKNSCPRAGDGPPSEVAPTPASVPDAQLVWQLLEAAAATVMWWAFLGGFKEASVNRPEGGDEMPGQVSEGLPGFGDLSQQVRRELPIAASRLRGACIELLEADRSPYVKFQAYSTYMCVLQLAVGVGENLILVAPEDDKDTDPGLGGRFNQCLPRDHVTVLWEYLNAFYDQLSKSDADGVVFDAEGERTTTADVYPAPDLRTFDSARLLMQKCVQASGPDTAEGIGYSSQSQLLLAVLASRMVSESQLDAVYTGPLGLLLLTQCERGRPKPLRDVACGLFRRLRDFGKPVSGVPDTEELAVQFFRLQAEAIEGFFECKGLEAAQSLSTAFCVQWGIGRLMPWLEKPLLVVLVDAAPGCITQDRKRLPLLEIYSSWMRQVEKAHPAKCRKIFEAVQSRCQEIDFDCQRSSHVMKFLRKGQPTPQQAGGPLEPPARGEEPEEEAEEERDPAMAAAPRAPTPGPPAEGSPREERPPPAANARTGPPAPDEPNMSSPARGSMRAPTPVSGASGARRSGTGKRKAAFDRASDGDDDDVPMSEAHSSRVPGSRRSGRTEKRARTRTTPEREDEPACDFEDEGVDIS